MKRILAFLLSLCLLSCTVCALAEETRTFDAGVYTFELGSSVELCEVTDAFAQNAVRTAQMLGISITPFFGQGRNSGMLASITGFTCEYPQSMMDELFSQQEVNPYTNFYTLSLLQYGVEGAEKFQLDWHTYYTQDNDQIVSAYAMIGGMTVAACSGMHDDKAFIIIVVMNGDDEGTQLSAKTVAAEFAQGARVNTGNAALREVVITGDTAKVRSEPSLSGGLITTAYRGDRFSHMGESGDFYIISIYGKTGYVHKGVSAVQ